MKKNINFLDNIKIVFFLILFLIIHPVYSLSIGKIGKVKSCKECHRFKNIQGNFIHPVLENKDCTECHKAHVSKYKFLLKGKIPELCFKCHREIKIKEESAEYIHSPIEKGGCLKCHNAHKGYKFLLSERNFKMICDRCHKLKKYKISHYPYKTGNCEKCHDPHYSKYEFLLKSIKICLNCHVLGNLQETHKFLKTARNCIDCHNPHGSKKENLLKSIMHEPYKQKRCGVCHSKQKQNREMCFQCHAEIKKDFKKIYSHYLASDMKNPFCINCHSPHCADNKYLLKSKLKFLCIDCHKEVKMEIANSLYTHPDIMNCLMCHTAHGSNNFAMLKEKELKLCVKCHKGHTKFGHPVGKKVKDPRNGQPITCTTCHNPMGTDYKNLLRLNGDRELCVECHKGY